MIAHVIIIKRTHSFDKSCHKVRLCVPNLFWIRKMNQALENTILNLLAASATDYAYPALEDEALDKISGNIADVVYETLKQKSSGGSTKRGNFLKFLNKLSATPECHSSHDHYKTYLKAYDLCKSDYPEAEVLLTSIGRELVDLPVDLHSGVSEFYRRKNAVRQNRAKKLERIKRFDQEGLSAMLLSKNVVHYATSQGLIDKIFENDKSIRHDSTYREKQVKFCYALTNIGQDPNDMNILERVLLTIATYDELKQFEVKLLKDLWLIGNLNGLDVSKITREHFPFVLDKVIVNFGTELLKIGSTSERVEYFSNLLTNRGIKRLQEDCARYPGLHYRLKGIIFELYVYSYCNENVLRLAQYIL